MSQYYQLGQNLIGENGDNQGQSISLSADGNVVAVGATYHNDINGVVRIYTLSLNDVWYQIGSDLIGTVNDRQGQSVSLSSDGNVVAIGSNSHDGYTGRIRIYMFDGIEWIQKGVDLIGNSNEHQGHSISLSSDGNVVATGAIGYDNDKGLARVYSWNGTSWIQKGIDLLGEGNLGYNDGQGSGVCLSANGNILAVGAFSYNMGKGVVKIFEWNGGSWIRRGGNLETENIIEGQSVGHGWSVSLSANGNIVAAGAPHEASVRVYEWNGTDYIRLGSASGSGVGSASGSGVGSASGSGSASINL